MTREELQQSLDAVAARMSGMRALYANNDELLRALAFELDRIEEGASTPADADYVSRRIDRLLSEAHLL